MPIDDRSSVGRRTRTSRRRRAGISLAVALLAAGTLSACGGDSGGRITLAFYNFPDNSGAIQTAADQCSTKQYKVQYNRLPNGADGQRQQMVRRLAAKDDSLDILGLDVTWESEFAEAGWIREWTGANKASASNGTLKTSLETATVNGKLYAVPYNTNTQLLWYRSDLVPTPPKTWDEMINDAIKLKQQHKPHFIEIQGAQYEGAVVWFNSLVAGAGGSILNSDSTKPALGGPAVKALQVMKRLADSPAADPSLSVQMEDANRLAMESGTAAFELNYPFVYPSMQSDNPKVAKVFKWAQYPSTTTGEQSHVTIGGIDLAVSQYSKHADLAFKAALCLRNHDHQLLAAVAGGLPPTLTSIYSEPNAPITFTDAAGKKQTTTFGKAYPFHQAVFDALKNASVRPKTPAYQSISIVISHLVSPASGINPDSDEKDMSSQIQDALDSKGLIP